jgi:lysophospholipase L1-like esterase
MACRFARTAKTGLTCAVAILLLSIGAPARAQSSSTVPVSRDCQPGNTAIATESALPQVAAALQQIKPIKILTIGASSGKRATRGGYAALIEQMLERAIGGLDVIMINRGISGELAANAAQRIRTEVALTEPTLVLWQVGTNDALAYVPVDQFETTLRDTIRWLKEHNVDVVLVGLQYNNQMAIDDHYRAVRDALRRVAAEEKVTVVRRYEAMQFIAEASKAGPELFDEIERTGAGYDCLAQYVARAITLGAFGKGLQPLPP